MSIVLLIVFGLLLEYVIILVRFVSCWCVLLVIVVVVSINGVILVWVNIVMLWLR